VRSTPGFGELHRPHSAREFARQLVSAAAALQQGGPSRCCASAARAEAVAQVFLGVRMQCAKCHNHPFDRWTQHDYHSLAAFFARIDYRIVENNRRDRLDKHEFDGEQIVYLMREGEVKHPRSGEELRPRFLGGPTLELGPTADRLQALADWIAAPDNSLFARAQANRVWYHLLGRGLVEAERRLPGVEPPRTLRCWKRWHATSPSIASTCAPCPRPS
jgi:hypothetical protein